MRLSAPYGAAATVGRPMTRRLKRCLCLNSCSQRIFGTILFFALISQFIFFAELFLERESKNNKRTDVSEHMFYLVSALEGKPVSAIEVPSLYFNGHGPQLWLESADGTILGGLPVQGFLFEERKKLPQVSVDGTEDGAEDGAHDLQIWQARVDWESGPNSFVEVIGKKVTFAEGDYNLFYAFENGPTAFLTRYFPYGLLILCLACVVLSYLLSRWLAGPLKRLQKEVLSINENTLLSPLTMHGPQEVVDVARSVTTVLPRCSQNTLPACGSWWPTSRMNCAPRFCAWSLPALLSRTGSKP